MSYRNTLSASSLTGDDIVNLDGEKIGNLEELMIDVNEGTVSYAVLSFGGFFGIGSKLFALPWSVLRVDEKHKQLVVDLDRERLESAPGFDKDHWPDFTERAYRDQIDRFYAR